MKKAKKKAKKQAKKQARKAAEACEDAVEAVEDAVEDVVDAAGDVAKAVVAAAERTMEELQAMAKRAFKKILEAAANAMVAAAQDVGTWARDDLKIPVPGRVEVNQSSRSHFSATACREKRGTDVATPSSRYREDGVEDDAARPRRKILMSTQVPGQAQFDAAAEMVSGVPFVGGSMASAMTEKVEEVAQAFLDALIAVATDPGCIKAFLDPILSIDLDDAMALCEKGLDGPALAEFFEEKCGAVVKETMTGVVEGALEACALTAAFPSAKEAYNAIAGKVPGLDEIDLDLPTYVLDNFVEGCKKLLCEKEYDAKAGAKDSGDDDLTELFGDFLDPDSSDSSDSESDAGDDATADAGGEGGATKVLTDLGASVTTMAEGMFATVGAPDEPE